MSATMAQTRPDWFGDSYVIGQDAEPSADVLKERLNTILDELLAVFPGVRLAAGICGFDEARPKYYRFLPETYTVKGTDEDQEKSMLNPPRLGTHPHLLTGEERPGTAMAVMEHEPVEPAFIDDVRKNWPAWMPELRNPASLRLASAAYIPLLLGSERVGIIVLQLPELHIFTSNEKRQLESWATRAALALSEAERQAKADVDSAWGREIGNLTRSALGSPDIDSIVSQVFQIIATRPFESVILRLHPEVLGDGEQTYFAIKVRRDDRPDKRQFWGILLEWPVDYWTWTLDPKIERRVGVDEWCLGYPLGQGDQTWGLLMVGKSWRSSVAVSPFLKAEKDALKSLAHQLSAILSLMTR